MLHLIAVIMAGLLESLAASSPAPPKIEHYTVKIEAANDEWTPLPMRVAEGDMLVFLAKGLVKIGEYAGTSGPAGQGDGKGALQLKVGTTSVTRLSEQTFLVSGDSGPAKLRVHDTKYTDNSGSFEVRIIKIPAELIPEAQNVE
jgi:hypothetical protein